MDLKHCTLCNQDLPKENFFKSNNSPDKLTYRCKPCTRKSVKESYVRSRKLKEEEIKKRGNYIKGTIVPSIYPKILDQPETIRRVVMAWMENPTATKNEIARITSLTNEELNYACYYNPYLKAFRNLAQKSVKNLIPLAVYGLKECLTSDNEKVKLQAALELLKSEKVLGAERIDVTVDDNRSKPIEEVRKLIQEAKLIPQPTISDEDLIGAND